MADQANAARHITDLEAQTSRTGLSPDGGVTIGRFSLPFSELASAPARRTFVEEVNPPPPHVAQDVLALRAHFAKQNERLVEQMLTLFAVTIREDRIGGVRVHRVTPPDVRPENRRRALICLHGGAFAWGADSGALVEAIPIASEMGVEVIAADYRLAPEHRFPAASQDVAAVYRELMERHAPKAIGIYGCSAGGVLTAQAVAWFAKVGLPQPGALAILGAGGGEMRGDSAYLAPALEGYERPTAGSISLANLDYFTGASPDDPCVLPVEHPEILRLFPPTLLIAGGRDFAASSATDLQLRLDDVGVDTQLFVFDGLWHAFHIYPDLPEARHVYRIVARFFDQHLAT